MLNVLCPMHIVFNDKGEMTSCGPTALKIFPGGLIGRGFLDVFHIKRPRKISTLDALMGQTGVRLNLQFRDMPDSQLQGVVMPGPVAGDMVVNLSFGISIVDAVSDYNLTAADFAATDLTVEMLYLVEAKSAAMEASRRLNERLQVARVEAEELALTDTLTGLKNRRALDQELSALLHQGTPFALMHIDLDFFKAVNDTLGHAAGDYVLQRVAAIMNHETRKVDVVARVGGDEFVILIKGTENHAHIERIAGRIIRKLQNPMHFENEVCQISGSIGTVVAGDYIEPTADLLFADADAALYAAKHAGRGCHLFFSPAMRDMPQTA
ncbi:GGDEF domain-containing protein [Roseobacter denitrificans]|nr:GGDEF domain-containing protein [Roseobacter denitrificans]